MRLKMPKYALIYFALKAEEQTNFRSAGPHEKQNTKVM